MGNYFITFLCAACGSEDSANPDKVPCLVRGDDRAPICRSCADKWNQMHKIDKGLPPLDYGDAYDMPGNDSDTFYDPDCPACLRHLSHTREEHEAALERNRVSSQPNYPRDYGYVDN